MMGWKIERIINFEPGDFCKDGFVHFGFHDREGRQYALEHQKHFLGLVGENDRLEWTVAAGAVFEGVPNIRAELEFPIYIDVMPDGSLVTSNFGNNRLYRIDVARMEARLFVDGSSLGVKKAGNCVVDDQGCVWLNEVEGCRVWRFDSTGKPILTLGDGTPGFQSDIVDFNEVRFNWIYDLRKGPDGNIYVLDSKNFAVRMIDMNARKVLTLAGTDKGGFEGDGGNARSATFGTSPEARFDGPISLSLDEEGNIYVGDRFNHVVRMIDKRTGIITTIAGKYKSISGEKNSPTTTAPVKLNLPEISSMDYFDHRLFVPSDITKGTGDLIVLRKHRSYSGT
jgi:DNA-binding beta-propeller fold protein YncE